MNKLSYRSVVGLPGGRAGRRRGLLSAGHAGSAHHRAVDRAVERHHEHHLAVGNAERCGGRYFHQSA